MSHEFKIVSVEALIPNEDQPRKFFDQESLNELSISIKAEGLITPIQVQPLGHGKYRIIDGERRWTACKLAGLEEVEVLVQAILDDEIHRRSVIANLLREDMEPLEIAMALQQIQQDTQWSHGRVAYAVGKSENYVKQMLKMCDVNAHLKTLLQKREVTPGVVKLVSSYQVRSQRKLAILVMKRLRDMGNYDARDLTRIVREEAEVHGFEKRAKPSAKKGMRDLTVAELQIKEAVKKIKAYNQAVEMLLGKDEHDLLEVPGGILLQLPGNVAKSARLTKRLVEFTRKIT